MSRNLQGSMFLLGTAQELQNKSIVNIILRNESSQHKKYYQ